MVNFTYINEDGEWVYEYKRIKKVVVTLDKCNVCGWMGLSEDAEDGCPQCKSKDLDDAT